MTKAELLVLLRHFKDDDEVNLKLDWRKGNLPGRGQVLKFTQGISNSYGTKYLFVATHSDPDDE